MDIINRLQTEAIREPHEPIWFDAIIEIQKFRAFARAIMKSWPEGDVDGGELQAIAVRHGLLTPTTLYAPCGDSCLCADTFGEDEFAEGITCYRKVDWLIGVDKE